MLYGHVIMYITGSYLDGNIPSFPHTLHGMRKQLIRFIFIKFVAGHPNTYV